MIPCAPDEQTWLNSPKMVLIFSHGMIVLVLPLHLFGAFCILRKTPSSMSSVKWTVLNLHFWNTVVDSLLNVFVVPCPLFPTVSGFLLGLLTVFGVRPTVQAWLLTIALSFTCVSTTMIFENRFYLLIAKNTRWNVIRPFWILVNFSFCFVYPVPTILQLPDQNVAREYVLNALPCVPEFLNDTEIIVPTLDDDVFIYSALGFSFVVFGQLVTFTAIIIVQLSSNFGANVLSANTRRLQKNLLKALILQTGIPFVYLLLPVAYAVFAIYTDFFDRAVNNMIVVVTSLHGFVSTSSMILIHNPYRKTVLSLFEKKKPQVTVQNFPIFSRNTVLDVSSAS